MQGGSKGNCIVRDATDILHILGDSCTVAGHDLSLTSSELLMDKYGMVDSSDLPIYEEHNYSSVNLVGQLSVFQDPIIPYIAGSTVKLVERKIKCTDCCQV